jgi:alanine-synthesizing transaminase
VEGGWNAVIRVPATRTDEDLAVELLTAKGVYVHPGHSYDFPAEGYVVVSLISAENDFSKGYGNCFVSFNFTVSKCMRFLSVSRWNPS